MRSDAGELDPGILEHLLQPLDRAAALIDLRLAQPRQITQPADLRRRHEARAHQPVLHQLANPLGVLDVGLAPGDVAQVVRVEQPALKAILERLEDRLPIHAGGLHPDERDLELGQPLPERRAAAERRRKRPCLLIPAAATAARNAHGRDHVVAVHVKPRAPLHHHIHASAPSRDGGYASPGEDHSA